MLGNFACFLLSADFLSKLAISKNTFGNTIKESNGLDPDRAQNFVEPDLCVNCAKINFL